MPKSILPFRPWPCSQICPPNHLLNFEFLPKGITFARIFSGAALFALFAVSDSFQLIKNQLFTNYIFSFLKNT